MRLSSKRGGSSRQRSASGGGGSPPADRAPGACGPRDRDAGPSGACVKGGRAEQGVALDPCGAGAALPQLQVPASQLATAATLTHRRPTAARRAGRLRARPAPWPPRLPRRRPPSRVVRAWRWRNLIASASGGRHLGAISPPRGFAASCFLGRSPSPHAPQQVESSA